MKKRITALISALALSIAAAGCSKKNSDAPSQITDGAKQITEGATQNIDMNKISDNIITGEGGDVYADLGGYGVSIGDAVVDETDDGKVLVVEFSFVNRTSAPTNFAGIVEVLAFQGDKRLPTAATYSAEGYDVMAQAQDVNTDNFITVQKAYFLSNDEPVSIQVSKAVTMGGSEPAVKVFDIK